MDKRTKIVATIGPSTSSSKTLKSMVKEGVNVFRINFSHGSHDDHIKAIEIIRQVDKDLGTHTAPKPLHVGVLGPFTHPYE